MKRMLTVCLHFNFFRVRTEMWRNPEKKGKQLKKVRKINFIETVFFFTAINIKRILFTWTNEAINCTVLIGSPQRNDRTGNILKNSFKTNVITVPSCKLRFTNRWFPLRTCYLKFLFRTMAVRCSLDWSNLIFRRQIYQISSGMNLV